MPLYTYECDECKHEFEEVRHLAEYDVHPLCPHCQSGHGRHVIVQGHGGSHGDEPVWLDDSVRGALQDLEDPTERPIENRTQYKRHLKDNGIVER